MPNTESATHFLQVLDRVHHSSSFTMALEHDVSIPLLGTVSTRCGRTQRTEVFKTNRHRTATALHSQRHVDSRYKKGLVNAIVNPAFRLSSTKESFAKDCNKLHTTFSKLGYPKTLVDQFHHKLVQLGTR